MKDWLTQNTTTQKKTTTSKSVVTSGGNDWLSSQGGSGAYKPNQLVSDIKQVTPTVQPKTSLISKVKTVVSKTKEYVTPSAVLKGLKFIVSPNKVGMIADKIPAVKEFKSELTTGFKAGVPSTIASLKKSGSDFLKIVSEGEKQKARAIPKLFKTEGEVGEGLSKESEKLKQNAIKQYKESKIENAKLPIIDKGSFKKNMIDPS